MILLVQGKLIVEKIGDQVHRLGRGVASGINRHSGCRSHIEQFGFKLVGAGQDNAGNLETHQMLECAPALGIAEVIEKPGFGIAENLDPLVGEEVGESGESKTRPVQFTLGNPAFLFIDPVQPAQLDIVVFADVLKKIGDRYRSLFYALLVEIHGTRVNGDGKIPGSLPHPFPGFPVSGYWAIFSLYF
jgi:hypothetical protein